VDALEHPCVWLRTREVHDVERLRTELATIAAALAAGSVDIRLGEAGLDVRDR
jgi:hypothetical protein